MDGNLNNFLDQVLGLEYSEYMTNFENMTKKQSTSGRLSTYPTGFQHINTH
jgi:hypothetical protein